MNRALLYLAWTQKKSAVRSFFRGLRRPRRLIGTLAAAAFIAFMIFGRYLTNSTEEGQKASSELLLMMLVFVLVGSVLTGLLRRGLNCQPADVDSLFCGPFSFRQIVLYRIFGQYPIQGVLALALIAFFLPNAAHPFVAGVALFLFLLVTVNLKIGAELLVAALSQRAHRLLSRVIVPTFMVASVGIGILVLRSTADPDDAGNMIVTLMDQAAFQVLCYPALAVIRLAHDPITGAIIYDFAILLAWVLGSLLIPLLLKVNFFEASLGSTAKQQETIRKAAWGGAIGSPGSGSTRVVRLPSFSFLGGAGAVVWKHLLFVIRSPQSLLAGVVFFAFFSVLFLAQIDFDVTDGDPSFFGVLGMGAAMPLLTHQYMAFDFRRDFGHITELKVLPVSARSLALAEVLVPSFICLILQLVLVTGIIVFMGVPVQILAWGLLLFPVLDVMIFSVVNLVFLKNPVPTVTEGGRPNTGAILVGTLLIMLYVVLFLIPIVGAIAAGVLLVESRAVGFAAGALLLLLTTVFLNRRLGRAFSKVSPAGES